MTDQPQWTSGVLPSDAKIGTDDPEEEAEQLDGQLSLDVDGDAAEDEEG